MPAGAAVAGLTLAMLAFRDDPGVAIVTALLMSRVRTPADAARRAGWAARMPCHGTTTGSGRMMVARIVSVPPLTAVITS